MKKAISLLSIFLLSSCLTTVSQNTILEENTGILGFKLSCENDPISIVGAYPVGTKIKKQIFKLKDEIVMICATGDLQTQKVKTGEYYIGSIPATGNVLHIDADKAMKFTINPNQINYIGDISTRGYTPNQPHDYNRRYVFKGFVSKNNKDTFVRELKEKHPKLIARYSVVYSPAAY